MAGCLKNEFIKLKNKLLPFAVFIIVLSGIMVLHLCTDVRDEFSVTLQLYKNAEKAVVTPEQLIEKDEKRISKWRSNAEKLRNAGNADEADKLSKSADFEESERLAYYKILAGQGVGGGKWQYDCVDARCAALARGESDLAAGFENALKENDPGLFLRNMCESFKEPADDLELLRYNNYSFLLETGCDPDKKANVSRAAQYAQNMLLLAAGGREEEIQKLNEENEWLKEAARHNAGDPKTNASFFYTASQSVQLIQIPLAGMIGVFAAAAVFGVDRKRKKIPAIYLLPAGRVKTNVAKLLAAVILSAFGLALYSLICLLAVLILGKGSMFETVFAVLLGKPTFCTPLAVFILNAPALIPVAVLAVSFVFFAVAITRNTPVSVVAGMLFAISFFACKLVQMLHPSSRYWLRYSVFSVADWTPFVVAVNAAPGQSFLWTAVSFTLHAAFFISLGLVLEKYSED
ncbi:MAG: hypothetical protein J6X87_09525 [Clostridia bacterium]|nr:hypothetical protein [Clostridia bacterium]